MSAKKSKSRIIISIGLILILIIIGIIFRPFFSKKNIEKVIMASEVKTNEYFKNTVQEYLVLSCGFKLDSINYAFVYEENFENRKYYGIEHYALEKSSIFSQNLTIKFLGATTIKNTTFPELVKMVKEDCSQFQQAKGDPADKTINWSYSPYTPEPEKEPEPERTQEEIEAIRQQALDQYRMTKGSK